MTDPNLDLFIEKITPPGQADLKVEYPGVPISEDILDENGNVLFAGGTSLGAETIDPTDDIKEGLSKMLNYGAIALIVTSAPAYVISETQNIVVISSGTSVTLPAPIEGIRITLKSNNPTVPLVITGGMIDGAAGATLAAQYDFIEIISDGTNWYKVASS